MIRKKQNFAISIAYLLGWKKDAIWLILGVIGISLLMFKEQERQFYNYSQTSFFIYGQLSEKL